MTTITSATTGIGEDVILDYIDIINNKKDAPDSFQNAVKINLFIGAFLCIEKQIYSSYFSFYYYL
ncbi:hypothetical protein [Mammaliicoccus fleurettii]|uniref:hypothetical protein n=1 Tax=Mammaliicoccus fleurettii TaxID=150056 RepID=UPI002DBE2A41|nr:hypothetical protein [Mammaliicoccus fleurettii]MEB8067509.1 hypothetical protein [Mammaliicoccus fleurettii]